MKYIKRNLKSDIYLINYGANPLAKPPNEILL